MANFTWVCVLTERCKSSPFGLHEFEAQGKGEVRPGSGESLTQYELSRPPSACLDWRAGVWDEGNSRR